MEETDYLTIMYDLRGLALCCREADERRRQATETLSSVVKAYRMWRLI